MLEPKINETIEIKQDDLSSHLASANALIGLEEIELPSLESLEINTEKQTEHKDADNPNTDPTDNDSLHNNSTLNNPTPNDTPTEEGDSLDAESVLILFDVVFAKMMPVVVGKTLKKKCTSSEFSLSVKEKKIIEPHLQKVIDKLDLSKLSPEMALLLAVGTIYGSKFLAVLDNEKIEGKTPKGVEKSVGTKGKGRRGYKKDGKGKIIYPKMYADTGELVNP